MPKGGLYVVVAQRTVALILEELGVRCHVVKKRSGYEGSEEVTRQAAEIFRDLEMEEVVPVAQPVLQLIKCAGLIRKAGFAIPSFWRLVWMIGWIGFDKRSVQPWTRDPFRLVWYTARQILFGYKPPSELSG